MKDVDGHVVAAESRYGAFERGAGSGKRLKVVLAQRETNLSLDPPGAFQQTKGFHGTIPGSHPAANLVVQFRGTVDTHRERGSPPTLYSGEMLNTICAHESVNRAERPEARYHAPGEEARNAR